MSMHVCQYLRSKIHWHLDCLLESYTVDSRCWWEVLAIRASEESGRKVLAIRASEESGPRPSTRRHAGPMTSAARWVHGGAAQDLSLVSRTMDEQNSPGISALNFGSSRTQLGSSRGPGPPSKEN